MRNPTKYPWEKLEIGKSFVSQFRFHQQITLANKRYSPRKFSGRKVDGVIVVTRIA